MKHTALLVVGCLGGLTARSAKADTKEVPVPNSSAPVLAASPSSSAPTDVRRHRGLFLRTYVGAGYRQVTFRSDPGDWRVSGWGGGAGLSVGAAIAEDLILYGDLSFESAQSLRFATSEGTVTRDDSKLGFLTIGPGISYYVMPANIHFGMLLSACQSSVGTKEATLGESEWGIAAAIRAGKDFWVNDNVGIGALAQVSLATMKDQADEDGARPTLNSMTATLAFQATYH